MKQLFYIFLIWLIASSCSNRTITISNFGKHSVGDRASDELVKYLSAVYPEKVFTIKTKSTEADIQLILSADYKGSEIELPIQKESYKIITQKGKLLIIGADERGLLNAVYSLLEKQGFGFYIGGDVAPKPREWAGFKDWEKEDSPILDERSLFNWHNFLSGCTGWNLDDWKLWIDQANKMRYNAIMVHASAWTIRVFS